MVTPGIPWKGVFLEQNPSEYQSYTCIYLTAACCCRPAPPSAKRCIKSTLPSSSCPPALSPPRTALTLAELAGVVQHGLQFKFHSVLFLMVASG